MISSVGEKLYPLPVFICFIWAGLVLGISFIEAPLKFQAPGITLGLGLGIGRIVFGALNKIELVLLTALIVVTFLSNPSSKTILIIAALLFILLLQTLWLLPSLDARADSIINNKPLPDGNSLHVFYVMGELIKLLNLIFLGFVFCKSRAVTPMNYNHSNK